MNFLKPYALNKNNMVNLFLHIIEIIAILLCLYFIFCRKDGCENKESVENPLAKCLVGPTEENKKRENAERLREKRIEHFKNKYKPLYKEDQKVWVIHWVRWDEVILEKVRIIAVEVNESSGCVMYRYRVIRDNMKILIVLENRLYSKKPKPQADHNVYNILKPEELTC